MAMSNCNLRSEVLCFSYNKWFLFFSGTLKNFHVDWSLPGLGLEWKQLFIHSFIYLFKVEINHCFQLDGKYPLVFHDLLWCTGIVSMCRTHCQCRHTDSKQRFRHGKWKKWIFLSYSSSVRLLWKCRCGL